jgi:hypothetical protein
MDEENCGEIRTNAQHRASKTAALLQIFNNISIFINKTMVKLTEHRIPLLQKHLLG